MPTSHQEYLATEVLNEGTIVSYRMLGRALGVHHNAAKQMLFDFHHKQNQRKPGSVEATYFLAGVRRADPFTTNGTNGHHDGDVPMDDSPFPSSAPVPQDPYGLRTPTTSIMLVREGDLEDVKAQFETLSSIHIHSLAAPQPKDINALAACNRTVFSQDAKSDPLKARGQYGTIQNPNVRRRTVKGGHVAGAPLTKPAAPKPAEKKQTLQTTTKSEASKPTRLETATSANTSGTSTPKTDGKAATKKAGKVDIFAAFSKGKQKPKATAEPEDEPMKDASEDEQEDDLKFENKGDAEEHRRRKAERQKALQNMMDEDDEPMDDVPDEPEPEAEEPEPAAPIDQPVQPKPEEKQEMVTVEGGRRRGRRRVMKRKTVQDDEGYLVTKEEAEWESFSEEEPTAKKPKQTPIASSAKGGKGPQKKGQGNIMSFFGKK